MSIRYIAGSDVTFNGNITVLGAITGNVTVSGSSFAQIIAQNLTPNGFIYPTTSGSTPGLFVSTAAATNGQLLIGRTGNTPVAATLTGTTNQVIVTNAAGSITLSTPQSIDVTSSPTFVGLTLSGITQKSFLFANTSGVLATTTAPTNGQLLIGSTGNDPVVGTLTGTTHQVIVTNAAGSITLSTPQAIDTTSNVTFGTVTNSSLTAHGMLYAGTAGLMSSTAAATNGQILIGSTGNSPVIGTISSGTAISVVNTAGACWCNNY